MTRQQDSTLFVASALVVSACVALSMQRSHKLQDEPTHQEQTAARSIQRVWWRFSRMTASLKCNQGRVSHSQEQEDHPIIVELVDKCKENVPSMREYDPVIPTISRDEPKLVDVYSPVGTQTIAFNEKQYLPAPRDIDEDDSSLPIMCKENVSVMRECDPLVPSISQNEPKVIEIYSVVGTPTIALNEKHYLLAPRDNDVDDSSLPDMLPHNMSPSQISFPVKGKNNSLVKPVFSLVALCAAIVMYMRMAPMTTVHMPTLQSHNLMSATSRVLISRNVGTVISLPSKESNQRPVKRGRNIEPASGIFGPLLSNHSVSIMNPVLIPTNVRIVVSPPLRESNQSLAEKRPNIDEFVSGVHGPFQSNDLTSMISPVPIPTSIETVVSLPRRESNLRLVEKRPTIELVRGVYGPYVSYSA